MVGKMISIWIQADNGGGKERSTHVHIVAEALQREYRRLPTDIAIRDV